MTFDSAHDEHSPLQGRNQWRMSMNATETFMARKIAAKAVLRALTNST